MSHHVSRCSLLLLSVLAALVPPIAIFAQNDLPSDPTATQPLVIGLSLEDALTSVTSLPEIVSFEDKVIETRERTNAQTTHSRPSLAFERQALNNRTNAPGFIQDDLKIEQRLPNRQRITARRAIGEAEIQLNQGEKAVAVFQKRGEIRKAFLRAFEAQEVLKTTLQGIDRLKEAQRIVSTRSSAGHSSDYETVRVELALAQEEDLPRQICLEFSQALSELAVALGRPLSPQTVLIGSYPMQPAFLQPDQFREMLDKNLHIAGYTASESACTINHPVLALSDFQQTLARREEQAARAENRPEWLIGTGYIRYHQDSLKVQNGYSLTVGVDLPVSRRARHEAEAAKARRNRAEKEKQGFLAQKHAEVKGAIETLLVAQARLAALHQDQEEKAARLVHMMQISQQAGLHSILELIDAHRLERDLNLAKARALMAVYIAFEDVHQALGSESNLSVSAKE